MAIVNRGSVLLLKAPKGEAKDDPYIKVRILCLQLLEDFGMTDIMFLGWTGEILDYQEGFGMPRKNLGWPGGIWDDQEGFGITSGIWDD